MTTSRRIATALIAASAIVLLAAGPVMIFKGYSGQSQIKTQLSAQKVQFPKSVSAGLPAGLASRAGQQVSTGPQAYDFATMLEVHIQEATGGKTYSEVSGAYIAGGRKDVKLAAVRQTAFQGEALRSSMLSAYQAWEITWLVIGLGALFTGIGLVSGIGVLAFRPRKVIVPASAEALESKHLISH
jgi:hypothetical protein